MGCGGAKTAHKRNVIPPSLVKPNTFIRQNQHHFQAIYEVEDTIGSGAFGHVISAVHKSTKERRAVKVLPKKKFSSTKSTDKLLGEVEILKQLDHPNIVRLYEFFQDEKYLYIVMELCNGGELLDEIVNKRGMDEATAASYMRQLLSAVCYCHSKHIVHRDLKPENLLLSSKSADATLKVIDFGTSVLFDARHKMKRRIGTIHYIAPEVLRNSYTEKCDVWSCGVILFVLLSGKMPFGGTDVEAKAALERGLYSMEAPEWEDVSQTGKNLVRRMLQVDPRRRISAEEAYSDPWVQQALSPRIDRQRTLALLDNLASFRAESKMYRAVLSFIVTQLISSSEEQELVKSFRALDYSGTGKISKADLEQGVQAAGITFSQQMVEDIVRHVDADKNGFIDYTEFLVAASDKTKLLSKDRLETAFAAFDHDGNGRISSEELRKMLDAEDQLPGDIWQELIRGVDQNGDGEVDLREFKEMMIKYF